ncbi:PIN domain nuclease [Chroococcidiopsis sp. CCALA 051]|uniref:PIN domain-containing protein n=1 Tax=Chroococcidiopsis sp. CCALA 051 TaxID=869949 RepID=UPI000D0D8680|nr:PIN domain-containing protein [Chroococcidiopsis sp. CCALA 051]PSM47389.1 PIN domain nuclease [Chroococcidiopsis sp. CCALA 051]
MMDEPLCFIDSNVWLYRLTTDPNSNEAIEVRKRSTAIALTNNVNGIVSTQVINETCSVLLRKAAFKEEQIQQVIQSFYNRVAVVKLTSDILINASDLRSRYSLSFWDGLIVATALFANADILYSEDMQDNLVIERRLTIVNPFK